MAASKITLLCMALFLATVAYQADAIPAPEEEVTLEIQLPEEEEEEGRFLKGFGKLIASGAKKLASKGLGAVKTYVKKNGKALVLKGTKAALKAVGKQLEQPEEEEEEVQEE